MGKEEVRYKRYKLGLWIGGKGNMKNCYSVEI